MLIHRKSIVTTNLDLHIKHGVRVDLEAQRGLHVPREALLVALLHHRPLLLECRLVNMLQQALHETRQSARMRRDNRRTNLELGQVLEELGLGHLQRLTDQLAEARVALVQPPARGDYQ